MSLPRRHESAVVTAHLAQTKAARAGGRRTRCCPRTSGSPPTAAILVLGFAFLTFLGDANARGQSLVSKPFERLAALIVYLSWFGLLWQFGFSKLLLMVACGATVILCVIYAASYRTAASRRNRRPPSAQR